MKKLLRIFLINLAALWVTAQIIPGLTYQGGIITLGLAAIGLMLINLLVVPMLHVLFLPLNLLTLGLFSWVINVIALFVLTTVLPQIQIVSYQFMGSSLAGIALPTTSLNTLEVAILASLMISVIANFSKWLVK